MPHPSDAPRHGGDLTFATRLYGSPADGWLDLSTGINPHRYPIQAVDPEAFSRLPDGDALDRLRAAAALAYGVPDAAVILAVPGSELAIRLLTAILPEGPVAVLTPGYSSHADACRAAGRTVIAVDGPDHARDSTAAILIGNPNNPDGRRFDPDTLADLSNRLGASGGLLVVDEAFADIAPELSLMPMLDRVPALVLRSFGKFFGLPGLRLGFVAGPPAMVDALGDRVGAWPVNTAAIAIGTAALADRTWQQTMRHRLAAEMAEMRGVLAAHGLAAAGGTDLFVLVDTDRAANIHAALAERGIWTRVFPEQPRHVRFGLAPLGPALDRLAAALAEISRAG